MEPRDFKMAPQTLPLEHSTNEDDGAVFGVPMRYGGTLSDVKP